MSRNKPIHRLIQVLKKRRALKRMSSLQDMMNGPITTNKQKTIQITRQALEPLAVYNTLDVHAQPGYALGP